jgi:hypothetical protein
MLRGNGRSAVAVAIREIATYSRDTATQVFVLEGLPQNPTFPWGNLVVHDFATIPGPTGNVVVPGDSQDHPLTDPTQGVLGSNNVYTCDLVNQLINDALNFNALSGGPHPYWGITSNSNSAASFLLGAVGINFGQPPDTPGWGHFN